MSNKDQTKVDAAQHTIHRSGVDEGQVWYHTKTRSLYEIVCLSVDEVRLVPLVTYRSLMKNYTWTRDLDVFLSTNENGDLRFTRES